MVDERAVKKFYDRLASAYGRTHANRFSDEIMEYFLLDSLPPGKLKILDVGCGVGRFAVPLARNGHEVVGLDLSARMLQQTRKSAQREDLEIKTVQGSVSSMAAQPDSFYDVAVALNQVLDFAADYNTALDELSRVVKVEGLLIGTVNNRFAYAIAEDLMYGHIRKFLQSMTTGDRYINWAKGGKGHMTHEFTLDELTQALEAHNFEVVRMLGIFNLFNKYDVPRWINDPKKREQFKQLQIGYAQGPEYINHSQEFFFVGKNRKIR